MKNTMEWALDQAEKAEADGDQELAEIYQDIASDSIEDSPMEIPIGLTGSFVTAEQQGKEILQ